MSRLGIGLGPNVGGGLSWSPLLRSDLAAWLSPSDGIFTERTGASATTPTAADGVVGTWRARNGTINGTAAADTNRPIYRSTGLNGTPGVEFDGSNDGLVFTTDLANVARNKSYVYLFAAAKPVNAALQTLAIYISSNTTNARAGLLFNYGGTPGTVAAAGRRLDADSIVAATLASGSVTGTSAVWGAEFHYATSDLYLRKNGQRVAQNLSFQTNGSTSDTASVSVRLSGDGGGNSPFNGTLGHVMIFTSDSALSESEMNQIEQFINQNSGLIY